MRYSQHRPADFERINPDRLGNVLELGKAEIADRKFEPRSYLTIGVFRQTDGAGLGDRLQSRGDIDAVAHQIPVALFNYIAEMNALHAPRADAPEQRAGYSLAMNMMETVNPMHIPMLRPRIMMAVVMVLHLHP